MTSTLPHIEGGRLGHANEVTAVIAGIESKYDSTPAHGLERFPIEEVLCVREIEIISPKSPSSAHQSDAYAPGELFCKSVLFLEYRNREEWQSGLAKISGAFRPMKLRECNNLPPSTHGKDAAQSSRATAMPYTFIDICCSIGDASEAAELAGLKVTDGIEIDKLRAMCYKANFPTAEIHCEDILNPSPKSKLARLVAAILHISMTCRYWSAAHTTAGKDDEKNQALLHQIPHLIKQIRPRQVMIEQFPGLV